MAFDRAGFFPATSHLGLPVIILPPHLHRSLRLYAYLDARQYSGIRANGGAAADDGFRKGSG